MKMSILRVATLALLPGPLLLAGLAAQAAEPRPKAVPVEPIYEAGQVAKGTRVVHDFMIRNDGDAPLEVLQVRPTCGCTVAEFDAVIAPGETGRIHAEVDTNVFTGPVATYVQVVTNDPDNPRLQLTIRADVEPFLQAAPGFARYIYVQGHGDATIGQTVWALDEADLEVVRVESPYPFLTTSVRPATGEEREGEGEGPQWRVELTLSEDAPPGALAEHVVIHTNHPKQSKVLIPVSGFVRPMVAVTPPELVIGELELTEPVQVRFIVAFYGEQHFHLERVESTTPGLEAEFTEIEHARRYDLIVTLGPEMAKGRVDTAVRIHTDNPKQPVVEVPVRGRIL